MKPLRNVDRELTLFRARVVVASAMVVAACLVLFARLAWLQLVRHDDFQARAEQNRIALVPLAPGRGLIKDRNGSVVAKNYSAYTLEIDPRKVDNVEQAIAELSTVVEVQPRDRRRFNKLLEDTRRLEPVPIRTRLSDEEVARFAAQHYRFPGIELRARLFRQYPLGETAAHLLGYIGRVSAKDQERIDAFDDPGGYNGTEYIGKTGIESSYEQQLHGESGYEEVEITAGGRAVRTLSRTPPAPGNNLVLALDARLQAVAEKAFGDRRGALVAIEPSTGEVLALVSRPSFDPNLFVDGIDPPNWDALNNSADKPLLNRALRGTYPIGSTYKPFLALAALERGKLRPETTIYDPGYYLYAGHLFRDSGPPGGYGSVDLHRSLVVSSDVYYYMLASEMGVDAIHDAMQPWGFGQLTGIDLEGESAGVLPSSAWKERRFKQRWYGGETISIGIGQGYNAFTLLQLAHATATLANDGVAMRPHVVRAIEDPRTGSQVPVDPGPPQRLALRPENLAIVRSAMVDVNLTGTARDAFADAPYRVAGKTGTAQVIAMAANQKYDEKRIAERNRDHSLYIAFAPAEPGARPRIALAVLAENSGFGARAAAPIARQVLDFYLLGKEPSRPALPAAGEDLPDADEMQESETLRAVNQGGEARQDAPAPAATADPGSAP
ncbi:MAG TPA: penicillin-binding protein 2 [Burkholderiaceae bacterium]|nr:penicillin-binding protein 2 [Burkholderiaceae bacterium]